MVGTQLPDDNDRNGKEIPDVDARFRRYQVAGLALAATLGETTVIGPVQRPVDGGGNYGNVVGNAE